MHRPDAEDWAALLVCSERQRDVNVVVVGDELADPLHHLWRSLDRKHHGAVEDRCVQRMEPELERRRDAEVRTRAAQPPEQVRILVLARAHLLAVGRDEVDADQVVDSQSVLALKAAHAAA